MTWTSRVWRSRARPRAFDVPLTPVDQEWLDAVNTERKKEQLDKVSHEVFEVVMDRLEKEWFNLVSSPLSVQEISEHLHQVETYP
jgi:hypothetical protein